MIKSMGCLNIIFFKTIIDSFSDLINLFYVRTLVILVIGII